MTCDKCGKELEELKGVTLGTSFQTWYVSCKCSSAERLISVIRKYKPGLGHHKDDNSTELELRLAAALEIAIETLKDVRSEMSSQNIDRLWCIDQISGSLEKINEVCK